MPEAGLIDVDGLPVEAVGAFGGDVAQDARAAAAQPPVHAPVAVWQAHDARLLQVSAVGQAADAQPVRVGTVDEHLAQPGLGPVQAVA